MLDLVLLLEWLRGVFRGLNMGSNKEVIFGVFLGECVGIVWGVKIGVFILGVYVGVMFEVYYVVICLYIRV